MALERGGRARLDEAAREQASLFLLLALPAAVGLALTAHPLAELMIGKALRAATASVTPLIALSALMAGLTTYYFGQAFTLGRNTRALFLTMAIPAGANVVLNLVLIPVLGLTGAALATALSYSLGLAAAILIGRRVLPLPAPWPALLRCGVATAVMAAVVLVMPSPGGLPELLLKAGVGTLVYGLVAVALDAAGVRGVLKRQWQVRMTREVSA